MSSLKWRMRLRTRLVTIPHIRIKHWREHHYAGVPCDVLDLIHNERCQLRNGHAGMHHQCRDGSSSWTASCFAGLDEFDGIVIRERFTE